MSTLRENLSRHSSQTLEMPEPPHHHAPVTPFSASFRDPRLAAQRKAYIKSMFMGSMFMTVVIFGVFAIYWGALWKVPDHKLSGWVVDFDGKEVGSVVVDALLRQNGDLAARAVAHWIVEQKAWIAVVVNAGASDNLTEAAANAVSSYDGTKAITVMAVEARNENAFRSILRPYITTFMNAFISQFAQSFTQDLLSTRSDSIRQILSVSPQVITQPIGYTIDNLRPFDVPVASAITFVGLIYILVLCFVIVQIGAGARFLSGLEGKLSTPSLIRVRLYSVIGLYFFISLFYTSLSAAFQVDFGRKYGNAGFVILWMLNFVAMCAVGLAMESMITIMTPRFIPFFVIFWVIVNVAVCFMPIEVLPRVYHYGYASPFYHVSCAVRSIIFRTKNTLGLNFAVLIIWSGISMLTLPLFQWFMRRRTVAAARAEARPTRLYIPLLMDPSVQQAIHLISRILILPSYIVDPGIIFALQDLKYQSLECGRHNIQELSKFVYCPFAKQFVVPIFDVLAVNVQEDTIYVCLPSAFCLRVVAFRSKQDLPALMSDIGTSVASDAASRPVSEAPAASGPSSLPSPAGEDLLEKYRTLKRQFDELEEKPEEESNDANEQTRHERSVLLERILELEAANGGAELLEPPAKRQRSASNTFMIDPALSEPAKSAASTSPAPTRRSTRARKSVNYNDDEVEEEKPEKPAPRKPHRKVAEAPVEPPPAASTSATPPTPTPPPPPAMSFNPYSLYYPTPGQATAPFPYPYYYMHGMMPYPPPPMPGPSQAPPNPPPLAARLAISPSPSV
ncbi:hypothetical protein CPB85DRAFT_1438612 [Mucidula mucida]|nr:hypothetical protein CPB85DRAFT_1438612 [Mucidula mucida]